MGRTREADLTAAFVTLADTLVADYDVVELLQSLVETCADLFDASAASLMLADEAGELSIVASTSEQKKLIEIMQLGAGPCAVSYATGQVVAIADTDAQSERWAEFCLAAIDLGFHSIHVVPLRLRGVTIGTLNLFSERPGLLPEMDAAAARGLADVATIGILHERALRESDIARQQLQHALDSRVAIEQAKGVIASLHGLDMDSAFARIRSYARSHQLPLRTVAEGVIGRSLSI